jgi:hypothetical protein
MLNDSWLPMACLMLHVVADLPGAVGGIGGPVLKLQLQNRRQSRKRQAAARPGLESSRRL